MAFNGIQYDNYHQFQCRKTNTNYVKVKNNLP